VPAVHACAEHGFVRIPRDRRARAGFAWGIGGEGRVGKRWPAGGSAQSLSTRSACEPERLLRAYGVVAPDAGRSSPRMYCPLVRYLFAAARIRSELTLSTIASKSSTSFGSSPYV